MSPLDSTKFARRRLIDAASASNDNLDTLIVLSARIPKGHPFEWLVWDISRAARNTSFRISDCFIDEKKQQCIFSFVSTDIKNPAIRLVISRSERFMNGASKMAIIGEIVEDSAYQTIVAYLSLPEKLCISLFPGKKQSTLITQLAGRYRKEVLISLPLEPMTKIPSGFNVPVIMVHFSRDNIRSIISQATVSIPHFSGFINVWGSRALEDSRVMNIVLSEIKNKHGFFIEVKSTKNSLAPSVAETLGVPYGEVTGAVFEKSKQADIEKQLKTFCLSAQQNGSVIITAPVTPSFIAALKSAMPWLRQNGVCIVPVSELVNKRFEQ